MSRLFWIHLRDDVLCILILVGFYAVGLVAMAILFVHQLVAGKDWDK